MTETITDEEAYETAKALAVEALVEMLTVGERLGRDQSMMAAEFMGSFSQAAEAVANARG